MSIAYPYPVPTNKGVQLPNWKIGADGIPDVSAPTSCYQYLTSRRQSLIDSVKQRPLLRLWDKNHRFLGEIAQEKSVMVEELMADSGGGHLVIRRDNWLSNFVLYDRRIEEDLHFTLDPVPTNRSWRTRWGGKVTTISAKRSREGLHTIEMELVSNREHVKHLLIGANPITAPEIQFPRMYVFPWNCRTNLFIAMTINIARQHFPLLAIPDNVANPAAWLGYGSAGIVEGFNPLWWPIQPQFVNPMTDQSRFEIFSSRWTDLHTASLPILEDAGCMIRAYTWLTEDEESPHPELGKALNKVVRPWRNCIVLAVEDKSGVTGPTGTFADGFVNAIAATADNGITNTILVNHVEPDGTPSPLFRKWFGVAPEVPWVVFRDGDMSGIVEASRTQHGTTAKTMMSGGKSPGWVNQSQTFGIKYGLSWLSEMINPLIGSASWGAVNTAYETPGTPGLDEIYQGQLDDLLLAYTRFTDPVRQMHSGDFGFLEHFEQGTGTGWTISTALTLRQAVWKTRAYSVFKVTIRNGAPYLYTVDFNLGDRVSFEIGGVFHTDQVTAARISWDDKKPVTVELAVGNQTQESDPLTMATRTLAGLWNMFGMFMGSNNMF